MTRRPAAALLVAILALPVLEAASPRVDPALEALAVLLDTERRARADDLAELERLTASVARFEAAAAAARTRFAQLLRASDPPGSLAEQEENVVETETRVRALQDARRLVASRAVDRERKITFLSDAIARRRSTVRTAVDPVTGRWQIQVGPGDRKGVMRLSLDGTLVSGDYILDGGFRGSVRGTYVAERLALQRIDSELGFDANFYGRLVPAQKRISGTWEATTIAPATGPTAGTWSATQLPDRDDNDGGQP